MDDSLSRKILAEIWRVREEKNISRKEISEKLKMPERTYTSIERGETQKIPAELILQSCIILDIDINDFIQPEKKKEGLTEEKFLTSLGKIDDMHELFTKFRPMLDKMLENYEQGHLSEGDGANQSDEE